MGVDPDNAKKMLSWDSLRMEMIYSRELGLSVIGESAAQHASKLAFDEVLKLYHRLKGVGKTKLFFEGSERSIRYLKDCLATPDYFVRC
jgi:hypothetical protein